MVQIRRFESKDADEVKRLINEIMNLEFLEDRPAFSFEDLDNLRDAYSQLGEAFFIAEDGKKIIGTVGVKREDDRIALIRRIFVSPAYRNKRIGLQLLNRAIEFCQEVGYQELIFQTTSRMADAIKLMRKRGFQSRAKVPLGSVELLKLSLSIKDKK